MLWTTKKQYMNKLLCHMQHYLIALKGNQEMIHKDVIAYCANKLKNSLISAADIAWLEQEHKWPGLNNIDIVTTTVWKKDKMVKNQRFYIYSLPANARQLNNAARAHWNIANQLHWQLTDSVCVRHDNAAKTLNI
jgi:predicted transposase YbfD/YdcC